MFIATNQKLATIALANVAAAGPLGTAAATVDVVSSLTINQTTAGIALTIPAPTDALAGDRLTVGNVGTAAVTVAGVPLAPNEFAEWVWSGTAWLMNDGGRNMGASVLVPTIAAAANFTVAHNLAIPTGAFSSIIERAYDTNGNEVVFKRNKAADTANVMGFYSPIALANITFDFAPLA